MKFKCYDTCSLLKEAGHLFTSDDFNFGNVILVIFFGFIGYGLYLMYKDKNNNI